MSERSIQSQIQFSYPAEEVMDWHFRSGALTRLLPPWWKMKRVIEKENTLHFYLKTGPIWKKWAMKRERTGALSFRDQQIYGPFSKFAQDYRLQKIDDKSCLLEEEIRFASASVFMKSIKEQLQKTMEYRHKTLAEDLQAIHQYSKKSLRILLSGSSGLIGSSLSSFLQVSGHQVIKLLRADHEKEDSQAIYWNPKTGEVQKNDFENFDAVIHLAGKNIAAKKWNRRVKEELFLSRCRDTWLLSQILLRLYQPPPCVISASAVGIYGSRGNELLTEESALGEGFLADLCKKWEEATLAIENRGSRVVHARFGAVLSPKGGLLARLLPIFRLGLGGRLGSGKQIISWIALDDVVGAIYHALMTKHISGALNVVAPQAISQQEFVNLLCQHLHRKARLHLSEKWLKILSGEMAEEMLLSSTYVIPKKLHETGYRFRYPSLIDLFTQFVV